MKSSKKHLCALVAVMLLMAALAGCGQTQPSTVATNPTVTPTSQRPTTAPTTVPTIPTQPTTLPTQPTTVPTNPEEPANPVPEELRNNYYLGHKGQGACEKMTGNITVLVVFVSDTLNAWSEYDMEQAKPALQECETRLEAAAAAYGAELDLTMEYVEAKISMEFKVDENVLTSAYTVMRKMGIGDAFNDQDSLEEKYEADAVPMLFVLNRQGRAFATTMDAETDLLECAVIYGKDMSSIRHELCHIFGALDFYFPDETIAAQERYLPDSIMNNHFTEVDDLTAYLIGWVDELSQNAINFLRATNHLTKEMIEEAQVQN